MNTGPALINTNTYQISNGNGTAYLYPHIDGLAEYDPLNPGALAFTKQFVIAYVDKNYYLPSPSCAQASTSNSQFGVNLYYAALTNPGTAIATVNDQANLSSTDLPNPADVALVERVSAHYTALYTYTRASDHYLFETEYDFYSPSPGIISNVNLDNSGYSGDYPRIDGIDNPGYNDPVGSNAYVMVVDDNSNSSDVWAYWNLGGTWYNNSNTTISQGLYPDAYPVVTCGPGQNYTVGYYQTNGNDNFVTQNITWGGTVTTSDYYAVDYWNIVSPGSEMNSVSSTINDDGSPGGYTPYLYSSWANDGSEWNKETPVISGWKHGNTTAIQNNNGKTEWKISPNPAIDFLELRIAGANEQMSYTISDITGRELFSAGIKSNNERVDISMLAPGMYLMHIYEGTNEVKVMKFVKE